MTDDGKPWYWDLPPQSREAVQQSDIAAEFSEIDPEQCPLGVFGERVGDDYELMHGDRVEIYRPLIADPKEVRKARAARAKERRASEQA